MAAQRVEGAIKSLSSGEPNTTGREVFEDSTATGPGAEFTEDNDTGKGEGYMSTSNAPAGAGTGVHHHGPHGGAGGVGSQAQPGGSTGLTETGEHHHHHHHHHGHHGEQGLGAAGTVGSGQYGSTNTGAASIGGTGQSGATLIDEQAAGSTITGPHAGTGVHHQGGAIGTTDKIGSMGENSALYERSGIDGPATTGAAGTDRFDTDRSRSGVTSDVRDPEAGLEREETRERGAGKGTGGIMGVLGTSDKDFVARDRTGKGAYEDDDAHFKRNTDGPGGNTALTGREGNFNANPVSGTGERTTDLTPGHNAGGADKPSEEAHKPSFMEKVKQML